MMLKIILCGYTQSVFSGRKIEALLKDSIRMMWLAQGYGQRDTVFRRIGEVERGNLLIVTTSAREFTCKVRKFRTVDANNRTVIVPKPRPTLTVTTCYPFRYIGDALERYIITADLIESKKEKGIRRAAWQSFFLW